MKKILYTVVLATFLLGVGFSAVPSFAISGSPTVNPSRQAQLQARCELVTARVNTITTRYEANKAKHVEQYQRVQERVTALVGKLEGKGYDVTKLKTDLQTLSTMRLQFVNQYNNFIGSLNKAKDNECGNSNGQFKSEVEAARLQLIQARETSLQIRSFILTTIKADLQALKAQQPVK